MSANSFIGTLKHMGLHLSHADGERLLIGLKITDASASLTTGRRAVVHYSDFLKFIAKHTSLMKKGEVGGLDTHGTDPNNSRDGVKVLRNTLRNLLLRHSVSDGI